MSRLATYRARWRGQEYLAHPQVDQHGESVRLRSDSGGPGFEPTEAGDFVRVVPMDSCEALLFVTTVCTWRGAECQIVDERGDDVQLEYAGGRAPQAQELGFERVERGVYRRWVPLEEIRGRRESTTVLLLGELG